MVKVKRNLFNKHHLSDNILIISVLIILIALSLFIFTLLLWGLLTSLKSSRDFSKNMLGFPLLDESKIRNSREQFFKLKNYKDILSNFVLNRDGSYYRNGVRVASSSTTNFVGMLTNTLLYAGVGGVICAIIPALTAYLCAKYDYALSKIMVTIYIVIMCIPIVGNYPTTIMFLRNTGLYNTFIGNYLQKATGSGMYFFVYLAFFKSASNTYREAAEIDGAKDLTIMLKIYFPLAIKMIATVFLIQFVAQWNDYQTPLLYLPTHPTLSYGVYMIAIDPDNYAMRDVPHNIAACMLLALPVLVLFIAFKDKIMGNISLGGIKE